MTMPKNMTNVIILKEIFCIIRDYSDQGQAKVNRTERTVALLSPPPLNWEKTSNIILNYLSKNLDFCPKDVSLISLLARNERPD